MVTGTDPWIFKLKITQMHSDLPPTTKLNIWLCTAATAQTIQYVMWNGERKTAIQRDKCFFDHVYITFRSVETERDYWTLTDS